MLIKFDEEKIANEIVKGLIYTQKTFNAIIDEESIIDDAFEAIEYWSSEYDLMNILVETVIEKLKEKNIDVVQ